MFYAKKDADFLMDFNNHTTAMSRDSCDRLHFYSWSEAVATVAALQTIHPGKWNIYEEDRAWIYCHLSDRLHTLYKKFFKVRGVSSARYHELGQIFDWEIQGETRKDRLHLCFQDFTLCYYPYPEVQLAIAMIDRMPKYAWTRLEDKYIPPILRTRMESFAMDAWSLLLPYRAHFHAIATKNNKQRTA